MYECLVLLYRRLIRKFSILSVQYLENIKLFLFQTYLGSTLKYIKMDNEDSWLDNKNNVYSKRMARKELAIQDVFVKKKKKIYLATQIAVVALKFL